MQENNLKDDFQIKCYRLPDEITETAPLAQVTLLN